MTTSAPRPTARQQLADLAAEHGWTFFAGNGYGFARYRRGDVIVSVIHRGKQGRVTEAERLVDNVQHGYVWKNDTGKRETVAEWLTEAVEQAPAPAAPAGPIERAQRAQMCPRGHGPLRWVDDAWICPKCGDEWPADEQAFEPNTMEQIMARSLELDVDLGDDERRTGTYATLDEAEAGQPRASVERLRELAQTGSTADVDILARDHARLVEARLDELEAERDAERIRGDQLAESVTALQARLDDALESELQRRDERDEARAQLAAARETIRLASQAVVENVPDLREQADRYAHGLDTLRRRVFAALDGALPGADLGPIPTDDQLVRDVVDLRADLLALQAKYETDVRALQHERDQAEALLAQQAQNLASARVELVEAQREAERLAGMDQANADLLAQQAKYETDVRALQAERDELGRRVTELQCEFEDLYDPPAYPREESDERT